MSAASHALALAHTLPTLSPEALAAVLRERAVVVGENANPLDLADLLVEPEAITRQLAALSREDLTTLQRIHSTTAPSENEHSDFSSRLITSDDPAHPGLRPEVAAVWPDIETRLNNAPIQTQPSWPTGGETAAVDLTSLMATVEGVEHLIVTTEKLAVDSAELPDASTWASRLDSSLDPSNPWGVWGEIAWRAGLIGQRGTRWRPSTHAMDWRTKPLLERAQHLIEAVWAQCPGWLVESVRGWVIGDTVSVGPLVDQTVWSTWTSLLGALGIVGSSGPTALAEALVGKAPVSEVMGEQITQRYDQLFADGPDSVVSAGPLDPALERTLRRVGQWQSGGLAARFRISVPTILQAMQSGMSAEDIQGFLSRAIPGGASSALGHLVSDTTTRAGDIAVSGGASGCSIRVADPLMGTLLVSDRRLARLGLVASSDTELTGTSSREVVHEALLDEGYPHLVYDSEGQLAPVINSTEVVSLPSVGGVWDASHASTLLDTWQRSHDTDRVTWFSPAIERAIDQRVPVRIHVDMNGQSASFELECRSVGNGRLRARDIRSDVERTIPVSHVVAITTGAATSDQS